MNEQCFAFTLTAKGRTNKVVTRIGVADSLLDKADDIARANFKNIEFYAIWDTGATNTVISDRIVKLCNLKPSGKAILNTAGGPKPADTYVVDIALPNNVVVSKNTVASVNDDDICGASALIGMDIISMGDFVITNHDGKTVFSYRIPSRHKIDFVQEINDENRRKFDPGGRNYQCGCGSGLRFKDCHGKD